MNKESTDYLLYILRHGIAVERGAPEFPDDDARPLTPKGKKKLEKGVAGLKQIGFEPDWIVTSPLVRAEETAGIVAALLSSKVPMSPCDALRPGGSFGDLKTFLNKQSDRRRILLVGHEPDLGRLVASLVGAGRNANLSFKKGGCCLIQWKEHPLESDGELVWWLTPRLMRSLTRDR